MLPAYASTGTKNSDDDHDGSIRRISDLLLGNEGLG